MIAHLPAWHCLGSIESIIHHSQAFPFKSASLPGHVFLSECLHESAFEYLLSCLQEKTQSKSSFVTEGKGQQKGSIVPCDTVVIHYESIRNTGQSTYIFISVAGVWFLDFGFLGFCLGLVWFFSVRDSKKL